MAEETGNVHTFKLEGDRLEYVGPDDGTPTSEELTRAVGIRIVAEDGSVAATFTRND